MNKNYFDINKLNWNKRTDLHVGSDFYDQVSFLGGKSSLKKTELDLLGNIEGKSILHLQCHFGQDSLSMARMGANVTGVDLSDKSVEFANELAKNLDLDAQFICCNLYDLPQHLDQQYDIVFTSYGTIGWLPDLQAWANIVSQYLKPNGQFIMVDFHPLLWTMDEAFDQFKYHYFNGEPIIEKEKGSYGNKDSEEIIESVGWNHGMAELIQALINVNLNIQHFKEYDYSSYPILPQSYERAKDEFLMKHVDVQVPLMYSIVAKKA
jgi:2-polyprenyl-3-methyl-5-hydroxy-6-metoxy-1,4-benzoquinol methylase